MGVYALEAMGSAMRVQITLRDGSGGKFQGEVELTPSGPLARRRRGANGHGNLAKRGATLDFELPMRAFIKRYARGLSGPRRFTLLLARLSGGRIGHPVETKNLEREWNRMTEPMNGSFNSAYGSRARDEGWVDTATRGTFVLRSEWQRAVRRDDK